MKPAGNEHGMTLVEILAAMILLSILSLIALRYMGVGLTAGGNAVTSVRNSETLMSVIERITFDYERLLKNDGTPLASLKQAVGDEGTSRNNAYGTYDVLQNRYITFDAGGNEIPDSTIRTTLKVKIRVENRELVVIFTE